MEELKRQLNLFVILIVNETDRGQVWGVQPFCSLITKNKVHDLTKCIQHPYDVAMGSIKQTVPVAIWRFKFYFSLILSPLNLTEKARKEEDDDSQMIVQWGTNLYGVLDKGSKTFTL